MGKKITIALAGNPNAGKSTAFNAITGARQHIANYPGVTVEKKVGKTIHKGFDIEVIDLPGIYSITAYSQEEIVARDYLFNERPDLVVDIVDASNLDRNLYLAIQFKELGVPMVLALNMIDLAETRGIEIDVDNLSSMLGIPVIPMVARANQGIEELLDKIIEIADGPKDWSPAVISYGIDIDQALNDIEDIVKTSQAYDDKYSPRWLALKCMEGDQQILDVIRHNIETAKQIEASCEKTSKHVMATLEEETEGIIADHRYGYIAGITKKVVKRRIESRLNTSDKVDKVLTNQILGPVIMLLILYGIFKFTFWASDNPVIWLENFFGWLKNIISTVIGGEGLLHSLIISGIIDGVGGVLGFVPLIMFMFFSIAILEDSGYMARVAYMLDRVLRWFGLHGNSVMALLISGGISGGCAVPGVMATRTLRDPKERLATLLVVPFMNCGAKLPLFGLLIATFFESGKANMMFLFTMLSWGIALLAAKIIRATVLRGPKTPFVMELPPYRVPTIQGLLIHTWERTWQYIKKAGTIILGISIILWCVMTFPGLPEERLSFYEKERTDIENTFFHSPGVKDLIKTVEELNDFEELLKKYSLITEKGGDPEREIGRSKYSQVSKSVLMINQGKESFKNKTENEAVAKAYLEYREMESKLSASRQAESLKGTIAGRIGLAFEVVSKRIGFDYRTNIALLGGFAAKEVIVSSLGTAYSLGEADSDESESLSGRLVQDPNWNPLVAFTLILFTMLYVPCFATVAVIKKESSWRWAGFSIVFNLIAAYTISLIVYQGGRALGIGLS